MAATTSIRDIEVKLFEIPLDEILSDSRHSDHTHFQLVTATLRLENGLATPTPAARVEQPSTR